MFFYVDSREMLKKPKAGKQYVAWYGKSSMTSPMGYAFRDVINGEEVELRSMEEGKLERFIRTAYNRAPYIKAKEITE